MKKIELEIDNDLLIKVREFVEKNDYTDTSELLTLILRDLINSEESIIQGSDTEDEIVRKELIRLGYLKE